MGMKGIVSTLDLSGAGLLTAGTFTRSVGLYDSAGQGDCIAVFSVADEQSSGAQTDIGGSGITQVRWSPCDRYLYVAERNSDGILVYDIRVAGKRLGCLRGRRADTNQRLGVDIVPTESGHEVWAGGTDGGIRIWANPWEVEGVRGPSWGWEAHDGEFCIARFEGMFDIVLIWGCQTRSLLRSCIFLGPWWLRARDREMLVDGGVRVGRARLMILMPRHRHRRHHYRRRRVLCMIIGWQYGLYRARINQLLCVA